MKRLKIIVFGLSMAATAMASQDRILQDASLLPEVCRTFMTTHYGSTPVAHIEIEKVLFWDSGYDVILTDGTNIEFTSSGDWKDIEGERPVPAAIVPDFIRDYVQAHYLAEAIVSIERKRDEYSIELSNGLELTFNNKGKLIEVD